MRKRFIYLGLLLVAAPVCGWAASGRDSTGAPRPGATLIFSAQRLFPGEAVVITTSPPINFHNAPVRLQFANYDADLVTDTLKPDRDAIVALLPIGLQGVVDVSLYLGDSVIATGKFEYGMIPVDSIFRSVRFSDAAFARDNLSYEVRTNGQLLDSGDITSFQYVSYEVFTPDPNLPQFHFDDPQQILYRIPVRKTVSPFTEYDVKVFRTKQRSSKWFSTRPRRKIIDSFQLIR